MVQSTQVCGEPAGIRNRNYSCLSLGLLGTSMEKDCSLMTSAVHCEVSSAGAQDGRTLSRHLK